MLVTPGLDPGGSWMPGSSPGMTEKKPRNFVRYESEERRRQGGGDEEREEKRG